MEIIDSQIKMLSSELALAEGTKNDLLCNIGSHRGELDNLKTQHSHELTAVSTELMQMKEKIEKVKEIRNRCFTLTHYPRVKPQKKCCKRN